MAYYYHQATSYCLNPYWCLYDAIWCHQKPMNQTVENGCFFIHTSLLKWYLELDPSSTCVKSWNECCCGRVISETVVSEMSTKGQRNSVNGNKNPDDYMFWPFIMDSGYVGLLDIMFHFDLDINVMSYNFLLVTMNFSDIMRHHERDTLSILLALCEGNPPFNIGLP